MYIIWMFFLLLLHFNLHTALSLTDSNIDSRLDTRWAMVEVGECDLDLLSQ